MEARDCNSRELLSVTLRGRCELIVGQGNIASEPRFGPRSSFSVSPARAISHAGHA